MKMRKIAGLAGALVAAALVLTGCTSPAAAPSDQFVIKVGDGTHDSKLHEIVYPGEVSGRSNNEKRLYFPGNSRNYIIDNRAEMNPDRQTPAVGYTKTGTPVNVYLTALWTVNQDRKVIEEKFFPYCMKYDCATEAIDPSQKNAQGGTAGWSKMLNTDMAAAIDQSVLKAMPQFDDTVWSKQADWDKVAAAVSAEFSNQMTIRTGYTTDLFCGSGESSRWSGEPGKQGSTFTCGPVRFAVGNISAQNDTQQQSANQASAADQQIEANQKIRAAAEAKYGPNGGDYLGIQDTIDKCRAAGSTCVISVGGANVSVAAPPANQPE